MWSKPKRFENALLSQRNRYIYLKIIYQWHIIDFHPKNKGEQCFLLANVNIYFHFRGFEKYCAKDIKTIYNASPKLAANIYF